MAAPVVVSQVSMMLMGFVDTIMVGHVSPLDLGAVAIGNTYAFAFLIIGLGTLIGLDPLVSQAFGAGHPRDCGETYQRGLVLALVLTLPTLIVFAFAEPALLALGEPPALSARGASYVHALMPGILPFYVFVATRQFIQGLGLMRPAMVVGLAANVVNAVANWVLIWGHLGFPALGSTGSGLATSFARFFLAAAILVYVARSPALKPYPWRPTRAAFALRPLIALFRGSFTVGLQYGVEVWAFSAITMMMGWLGTTELGGHQITLNLLALAFMVPVGIANAASVRVGHAIGRDDSPGARRAAKAALILVLCTATISAALFSLFPGPIARLYTPDASVIDMAVLLLPLAALSQFADGLQSVGFGILRGAGDTRLPFIFNVVGYWVIGLPIGYLWTFHAHGGPKALWWGISIGLAFVAIGIVLRIRATLSRATRIIS
jgi:MATE family multidrug resistance protein